MQNSEKVDGWISDIVGALFDPIIVFPGGWEDTIPELIKTQITLDRLIENVKTVNGETPTGTDAEAAAYLYTLSLARPISEQWTRIYLYVAGKTIKRVSKSELPEDIKVDVLSENDIRELGKFKEWLYKARIEARKNKDRDARREAKNAEREVKQPYLFAPAINKQIK